MATGMFPGKGSPMYRASSTANEPVWTAMRTAAVTIPDGSSSVGFALNAGITTSINVLYATAPSGTAFNVMYADNNLFTNEYVYKAVASVASQKLYTYSVADELDGFFRITNSGSQTINEAYLQQRASYSK